jgi:hypothetical protein
LAGSIGVPILLEAGLGIYQDLGDRLGQAYAINRLSAVRRLTGDHQNAAEMLDTDLGIYRDLSDQGGEAETLNEAGTLHQARGDLGHAWKCHQRALDLARKIGSLWDEAQAQAGLGRCALAAG